MCADRRVGGQVYQVVDTNGQVECGKLLVLVLRFRAGGRAVWLTCVETSQGSGEEEDRTFRGGGEGVNEVLAVVFWGGCGSRC